MSDDDDESDFSDYHFPGSNMDTTGVVELPPEQQQVLRQHPAEVFTRQYLIDHQMMSVDDSEELNQNYQIINVRCFKRGCRFVDVDLESLYRHLAVAHRIWPFVCPLARCGQSFVLM